MKFKHKVYDHKMKVGIDLGGFGPNSLGIRVQNSTNKHFSWFLHYKFSIGNQKSMKF